MISLRHLNKIIILITFFIAITLNHTIAEEGEAVDIWEKQENQNEQNNQTNAEQDLTIESPILSDDINKIVIKTTKRSFFYNFFTNPPYRLSILNPCLKKNFST